MGKLPRVFQMMGVTGFVLTFLQISIGWFIGFFFSGLFFFTLIKQEHKHNEFNLIAGVLAVLYSFYCLFTQVV